MDWVTIQGNYFVLLVFAAALGFVGFFIGATLGYAWNQIRFQAFPKTDRNHYGNSRWQGPKITFNQLKKDRISAHKLVEFRPSILNTNLGLHAV